MSERTDERTLEDDGDVDLDGLDQGGTTSDVGFDEDELGVDVDALTGEPSSTTSADPSSAASGGSTTDAAAETTADGPGLFSRLRPSVGSPFGGAPSGRDVGVAMLVVVGSMLAGSAIPIVGSFGGPVGVFVGTFLLGLVSGKSRYLELAVAGALAAGLAAFLSSLQLALLADIGLPLAAFGAVTGLLAAVVGHYFGRDLRSGLTRDV